MSTIRTISKPSAGWWAGSRREQAGPHGRQSPPGRTRLRPPAGRVLRPGRRCRGPVLFLLAFLCIAPAARAAAPDRKAVEQVLRTWDAALISRDLPRLLDLYDSSDSLLLARARENAGGWIALDTLSCSSRLGSLTASGDTMKAATFRELTWREHGREQCLLGWNTMRFRRGSSGWKISLEKDRTYTRAERTELRVDLKPEAGRMEGEALLRVGIVEPGEDNILLGLSRGLVVTAIRDEAGTPVPYERIDDAIVLPQAAPLRAGESRALTVTFGGALFNESRENGYSQVAITPEGCFASWVTNWYPHVQGLGSKSPGRITFEVPSGETVVANGRPVSRVSRGDREEQVFEVHDPVDFSFAVGRYFHREEVVDGVTVGVYFLEGGEEKASLYLPVLARILRYERDLHGMYPFDSYSIVEIPSGPAGTLGGSSEQGMNLFPVGQLPDASIPLPLLAHEMGHSWWGNFIQGKEGAIIQEAMAQMMAVLLVKEFEGEASMRRFLHRGRPDYPQSAKMYFESDAGREGRDLPLATPPSGSEVNGVLHELADTKGHFVYNMLRETIGTEAFVRGLRAAVSDFGGKEISLRDMQREWETASGRNLDAFFSQWFHRSGAPDLTMHYDVVPSGGEFEVRGTISQSGEPYAVPVEVAALRRAVPLDTSMVHTVQVAGPETSFSFPTSVPPDTVVLDPRYKLFRWTDEFRDLDLLHTVRRLRSAGLADSAAGLLAENGKGVRGGLSGLYQLGLCYQAEKDLSGAETCFREARDRGLLCLSDDPAVVLSALHVGRVCDLAGRREEAKRWYAEVLAGPDEQGAHADAQAGLAAPYAGPDRATLQTLSGTYAAEGGLSVVIAIGADSLLTVQRADDPPLALEWERDLLFRTMLRDDIALRFKEGAPCPGIDVDFAGRTIHLKREE